MKKVIIFLMVLTGLVFAINEAMSMTEAIIDAPTCISCGACWGKGEPYFPDDDGTACWGPYQTGEFNGLRFYSYPSGEHIDIIEEGLENCPVDCILSW